MGAISGSVLLGKVPMRSALQPVPPSPGSPFSPRGLSPQPFGAPVSNRAVEVLTSLQAEAYIVLVDSPPVLPVTDALVLSGRVDATLLVWVAGATARKDAARAVELLQQIDAPLVGTVLNGVTCEGGYDYGYYESSTASLGRSIPRSRSFPR